MRLLEPGWREVDTTGMGFMTVGQGEVYGIYSPRTAFFRDGTPKGYVQMANGIPEYSLDMQVSQQTGTDTPGGGLLGAFSSTPPAHTKQGYENVNPGG